ncbi:MAG: methylmalonyl-CoA epimerase [Planctomycetes bacterium]|nr:methylmalonyl-CoA epimerase [Planctomycetota bacterium]
MAARIEHLGVAVPSLEEGLKLYRDLLGFSQEFLEEVASERVRVAGLAAGGLTIELLEPTSPDSAIASFLAKRGPGLHHVAVAVEVEGLAALLPRLKAAGVRLLDDAPRPGSRGTRVAFIHPKGALGVLIELVERPAG